MALVIKTVIYPVKDLSGAKTLYGKALGVDPVVDQPYYVQFNVGEQQIGLDPNGHAKGMTGPLPYWEVDDIDSALDYLQAAGAEVIDPKKDVGGGMLIAWVKDADGNTIALAQSP